MSSNPDFAVFGLLTSFETVKKFLPKKRRKARSNRAFRGDIFFVRLRWRRVRDSNPRNGVSVYTISNRAPSARSDNSPWSNYYVFMRLYYCNTYYLKMQVLFLRMTKYLRRFCDALNNNKIRGTRRHGRLVPPDKCR